MIIKHFIATVEMLLQSIAEHNANLSAHGAQRIVISTRNRDPEKPTYGVGSEGDDVGMNGAVLETSAYTGTAETSAVVSGIEYDANNLSSNGDANPDGTIIFKKLEE